MCFTLLYIPASFPFLTFLYTYSKASNLLHSKKMHLSLSPEYEVLN